MIPSIRRSAAFFGLALAQVVGLAIAGPALAAAPPAGILFDASVAVTVREPSPDGGATPGVVIPGADVTFVAYLNDFDNDPLQVLSGETGAGGTVVFTGVARSDRGGPTIQVAAEGLREVVTSDAATGCTRTESWFGLVADHPSAPSLTVIAAPSSSLACPPKLALSGTILAPDGSTLDPALATVSVVVPPAGGAEAYVLDIAPNGSFDRALPAWGTFAAPAVVTLRFVSAPTRFESFGAACVRTYAQQVTWTGNLALAEGGQPPVLALRTEEFLAGEQCGVVSAPAAGASTTLPPTDAVGAPDRPGEGAGQGSAPALVILAAAALLLVVAGATRSTGRRGG